MQSNNSSATFLNDTNKNRKKLPNYIKDKNYGVSTKLQNDNFISPQKLNNLKNNYNEIKILLYNKLKKLEQNQQMQFDNLKSTLIQGGRLKMKGVIKKTNSGNNSCNWMNKKILKFIGENIRNFWIKKNEAFGYKKI